MASSKDAHRNGAHGPKVIVSSRGGDSWFKFLYFIIRKFKGRTDRFCSSRQTVDAAVLKNNLRENFEEAKFDTGKLRNHYPPPLCSSVSKIATRKKYTVAYFEAFIKPYR